MNDKKQLTVRLPKPIYNYISEIAHNENKSLNDIIVDIAEEFQRWHNVEKTMSEIDVLREKITGYSGIHPNSVDDLQKLRDRER